MKECKQISELCTDLHEGNLDDSLSQSLYTHMDHCPDCRADFIWYGLTVQALTTVEQLSPPPNFLNELNQKLYSERFSFFEYIKHILSSTPHLPLPVGVSALAAIVLVGIVVIKNDFMVDHNPFASNLSSTTVAKPAPIVVGTQSLPVSARTVSIKPYSPDLMPLQTPFMDRSTSRFPSVAEVMNSDLTVQTAKAEDAIESLKKVLPGIKGAVLDNQGGHGNTVLAVRIPQETYSRLTTELVKHGAVTIREDQAPSNNSGGDMILYIRFVH
jgi:hypothetical protein